MRDERLEVSVTFDERRGYIASAPELPQPVLALSLGGLRRKIEIALLPDDVDVRLVLDRAARRLIAPLCPRIAPHHIVAVRNATLCVTAKLAADGRDGSNKRHWGPMGG
jgi:hypothetical protein